MRCYNADAGQSCAKAKSMHFTRLGVCAVLISLVFTYPAAQAASPTPRGSQSTDTQIDFFAAKEAGQISVRIIPQDEKSGQVIVTNNTAAPLAIKLPETFAAVPILAQRRGGAGPGLGPNGSGGATQSLGGTFPPGSGQNPGGRGIGPGVFNIGPDKVTKI